MHSLKKGVKQCYSGQFVGFCSAKRACWPDNSFEAVKSVDLIPPKNGPCHAESQVLLEGYISGVVTAQIVGVYDDHAIIRGKAESL